MLGDDVPHLLLLLLAPFVDHVFLAVDPYNRRLIPVVGSLK